MKTVRLFVFGLVMTFSFCISEIISEYENNYGVLFAEIPNVCKTSLPEVTQKSIEGKININTATKEELCTLYGIGEKFSERIIRYREEKGNFKQIQDIMKVSGIGKNTFFDIQYEICV